MIRRLLVLGILAAVSACAWLGWDFRSFLLMPLSVPEAGTVIELKPGTSLRTLASELEAEGIVSKALYLQLLARWEGQAERLQAGEYRIERGTLPAEFLLQLVEGRVVQYAITLVEGWTFSQLRDALERDDVLNNTLGGLDDAEVMRRLGREGEHPEGRFFPDTYRFPRGATDVTILGQAYSMMENVLNEEWSQRAPALPLDSPYDALVLASIVERETGLATERPLIAGVFVRRLRKGMKLQTDPTVIYGLGEAFDGNLTRRHLQQDTPYNTYVRSGLTPTPICMPGRAAIHAVLHPADGKSLYFVAKGDGSHEFSATLKSHNRAVRTYQLNKRR